MNNRTPLLTLITVCLMLVACDDTTKSVDQCGDGIIDLGEDCDGVDLGGQTCLELGYSGGTLSCTAGCGFDLTGCEAPVTCGNGQLDDQEQCDGALLSGQTCLGMGYSGGELGCNSNCSFSTDNCTNCGNGVINSPEVCDGTAFNGQTCVTQGFDSGTLGCNESCTGFVTTNCESTSSLTMIQVPAGTFQRDATATNLSTVSAFRMSRTEITRDQWTAVTGWADPSDITYSSGTSDPVQMVSWYDAIAFCNKLSLLEGLTPVYAVSGVDFRTLTYAQIPVEFDTTWDEATANWAANGYRLPTEMEWMWAAMGADTGNPGVTNTTGYLKAFAGSTGSNLIWNYAVFGYETSETGRTTTQRSNPVGSKLANELGFHDLSGNVWEWAWDWDEESYPTGTLTDYRGAASGLYHVIRGGGWDWGASHVTVAARVSFLDSYARDNRVGFRIVGP